MKKTGRCLNEEASTTSNTRASGLASSDRTRHHLQQAVWRLCGVGGEWVLGWRRRAKECSEFGEDQAVRQIRG